MVHDDDLPRRRNALALLRALGAGSPAPKEAMRSVADRLAVTLSLDPGAFEPQGPLESPAPTPAPIAGAGEPILSRFVSLSRPWMWTVGGALSAAVAGGATHAAFWPREVRVVYVETSPPALASTASFAPAAQDRATEPSAPATSTTSVPARRTASVSKAPPIGADAALARERTLLDAARRKLARGEAEASLSDLAQHAKAFPEGKLAEEREALFVNALVGVGKYDEARRTATAFRTRYPHSFLSPSVDAAISAIP
jgi:hypothetical protein